MAAMLKWESTSGFVKTVRSWLEMSLKRTSESEMKLTKSWHASWSTQPTKKVKWVSTKNWRPMPWGWLTALTAAAV